MTGARFIAAWVVATMAGAPLWARAQGGEAQGGPGDSYGLKDWPEPVSQRPLTLGAGMLELTAPVNVNLTDNHLGEPISINPSLYYGLNDSLSVGVRTFTGLCISGSGAGGCPKALDDFGLDSVWNLGRSGPFQMAIGVGLDFPRLSSPTLVAAEARFEFKWGGPRVALVVSPTLSVGFSNRDDTGLHTISLSSALLGNRTLLTTTTFGNRETLTVPVGVQFQLTPKLALLGDVAVTGPLDPVVGSFPDYYTIPVSFGGVYALSNWADIGVTATWPRLIGGNRDTGARSITGALALRF